MRSVIGSVDLSPMQGAARPRRELRGRAGQDRFTWGALRFAHSAPQAPLQARPCPAIAALLCCFAVLVAPVQADQLQIVDSGRVIGRVVYASDPVRTDVALTGAHVPVPYKLAGRGGIDHHDTTSGAGSLGRADRLGYLKAVTRGVLRARRELARLGWPVEQQAVDFTIEVTDLGTDRLGVTDRSNRMRITVPDRMAEPGEDLSVALSALLAHEYLHLCQYRCLRGARAIREERFLWWMEATAIYLEYRLAPVDPKTGQKRLTYVDAVSTGRGEHSRSGLESAAGGSSLGYAYAPLAFLMADALGPEALVRTWMQIAADSRVDSAVEAIELCLSEPGEARHTFGELFEAYARHMASGASSAVRTDLGLDVVEALDLAPGPAGASTTRISLPGLSFSVFALRPGRGDPRGPVAEFRGAPGLKAFRLEGCDDRRLEPDRLVVVNVSRTEKAGRILWGPKPAAPGAGPRRTARGGPGRPVPSNGPPGFDAPRPSPGGAAGRP